MKIESFVMFVLGFFVGRTCIRCQFTVHFLMVIRLIIDCRKVMGDLATIAFVVPLFEIVGETPRMTFARNGSRAA